MDGDCYSWMIGIFMDKENGFQMDIIDYILTTLHNYCNYSDFMKTFVAIYLGIL